MKVWLYSVTLFVRVVSHCPCEATETIFVTALMFPFKKIAAGTDIAKTIIMKIIIETAEKIGFYNLGWQLPCRRMKERNIARKSSARAVSHESIET